MESQSSILEKEISFSFPAEILKQEELKGEFHIVGYAATTDFDLQGDVITEDALKNASLDLIKNSTVLLNHEIEHPIGKVTKCEFDEHGLLIDCLISKTEPEIIQKIKEGVLNKFSIRGQVLERDRNYMPEHDRVVNVIHRMSLMEVSLVSVPANPEARAIGWYISKALRESDKNLKGDEHLRGGSPMPKDKEKSNGKILKTGDDRKDIKKEESPKPDEPKPEPQPAPAPQPNPPQPQPTPTPQPSQEEVKKNLVEVLRTQLEPVFSKLTTIIELGGETGEMAKEIWAMLKAILGDPIESSMPAAKSSPSMTPEQISKMVEDRVQQGIEKAMKSIPPLRKGFIQKEPEEDTVLKTFEGLPPNKKLRVALAMSQQ